MIIRLKHRVSKLGGCHAYPFGKSSGEGAKTLLTDLHPDIPNAQIRTQQQILGHLQPKRGNVIERRQTDSFLKNARKMVRTIRDITSQQRKRKRFIDMLMDVCDRRIYFRIPFRHGWLTFLAIIQNISSYLFYHILHICKTKPPGCPDGFVIKNHSIAPEHNS